MKPRGRSSRAGRRRDAGRVARASFTVLVFASLAAAAGVATASAQGSPRAHVPPGYPQDKADRVQRELDEVQRRGQNRPKPSVQEGAMQAAAANPAVAEIRSPGINNEMHQGPFPASEFRVSNFYQGPAGTQWYLVYAGATVTADGGTGGGAVRVISESATNTLTMVGTFNAPVAGGALHIVGYQASTLTLATDSGRTVRFALDTLQFK